MASFANERVLKNRAAHSHLSIRTLSSDSVIKHSLKKIAEEFNLDENKLQKIYDEHAYKLDGNILADSYSLPVGMSEEYILFYLYSQTNKKYEEFSKKIFGKYDKEKWFRYISLASVIQKEAATTNEMPIIASVVHNRLKKNMALQMDGTLNYGKYSNSVVTADRIRSSKILGRKVKVSWTGNWYDATIIQVNDKAKKYFIHYDGWSSTSDEWVGVERIKF